MKRILLIEDDQTLANIYRNKFAVEGYEAEIASDGEAGVEAVRNFRPDAVILDLLLPKLSGVEVLKQIRAEPNFQHTPIVVFSNTYLTNLMQQAWKAGATKCLSKANCTPKQVIEIVRNLLPALNRKAEPAGPPAGDTVPGTSDAEFQAGLHKSFLETLPATTLALRALLQGLVKAADDSARLKNMHELYRRIHTLTGNAGLAGLTLVARMCDAFEALLKELHEKPKNLNPSTLRTVAMAVDFLGVLFEKGTDTSRQEMPPGRILVVDDEIISRRAVTHALEKAKLKSVSLEDAQAAYTQLVENKFDLVILDVDMPGMNGFELCTKLRALPAHSKTPVVFVTSLDTFESRANSTISGANDFIAKPFLFIELAVKALVYVMRGWVDSTPSSVPAPSPTAAPA